MTKTAKRIDDRYSTNEKYTTINEIAKAARLAISDRDWNYLFCGTGDNVTLRDNTAAFDTYRFRAPIFTGVANPTTSTRVLDMDLSFPAFTAPVGGELPFHHEGHKAVGRAVQQNGIFQIVPMASSFSLEDVAAASSAAAIMQIGFVGDEDEVLAIIDRVKAAGYRYILASFFPTHHWREAIMETRYTIRGENGPANFGEGRSNLSTMVEQLEFTTPRWDWAKVKRTIARSSLPVVIKGVLEPEDAVEALRAGAVGINVSNYGGRSVDRLPPAITQLRPVREKVGSDVPIIFDSGVRRGSDIVTALALGANAVAIGRPIALGLAADGETGVSRTLELFKREFWVTMGHLGCSSVEEITPRVLSHLP